MQVGRPAGDHDAVLVVVFFVHVYAFAVPVKPGWHDIEHLELTLADPHVLLYVALLAMATHIGAG